MKHFEKNVASGAELIHLHQLLMKSVSPLAINLFFHEARDAETPEHRETLARSAYNLIGICEAIIDRVPQDEASRALDDCREHFAFDIEEEARDLAETIMRAFGRF